MLDTKLLLNINNHTAHLTMLFLKEFWEFLKVRKKYWLLPILLALLLISVVVVVTEGTALSPFIYAIF